MQDSIQSEERRADCTELEFAAQEDSSVADSSVVSVADS